MATNSLDFLKKHRPLILFVEMAALLHDVGKLSRVFIEYRQGWQTIKGGYKSDPHLGDHFCRKEVLKLPDVFRRTCEQVFKSTCKQIHRRKLPEGWEQSKDFSILKVICEHEDPEDCDRLMKIIKAADSNDSAVDRNNPFFSAEQKVGHVFRSNVFGYESGTLDLDCLERQRKDLYQCLAQDLEEYFSEFSSEVRKALLARCCKAFEKGLSDTCRPQNDTSLWEHAYAVASIAKVLLVHNLFRTDPILTAFADNFGYGIWGVGWDGMRFLSYGQKVGDIVARKNIIEDLKFRIRNIVEWEYPVGNAVYHDDDGVYFIVPADFNDKDESPYRDIYQTIREAVIAQANEESQGEIQPAFAGNNRCRQLTAIAGVIDGMKKKTAFRFRSGPGLASLLSLQQDSGSEVCSICRLRPVDGTESEEKICKVCLQRRGNVSKENAKKISKETIFTDEIVDCNSRAALVVACFDLRRWLNGEMIRTLFVSEARGIENEIQSLDTIEDFKGYGEREVKKHLKDIQYDYDRICKDLDALLLNDKKAANIAFLYSYGRKGNVPENDLPGKSKNMKKFIERCRNECGHLAASGNSQGPWQYNFVNAKSPTPSTLLDVWRTTRDFFRLQTESIIQKHCEGFKRLGIKHDPPLSWSGTLKAQLDGEQVELLDGGDPGQAQVILRRNLIDGLEKKLQSSRELTLVITDSKSTQKGRAYKVTKGSNLSLLPYRVITFSPYLFMAMVPADCALPITRDLYAAYQQQMGKVTGRLPFCVGNLFFKRKLPMFVLLDAARRMIGNFRHSTDKPIRFSVGNIAGSDNVLAVTVEPQDDNLSQRTVDWQIPVKLGNGDDDFHHPYALLRENDHDCRDCKGFFETVAGPVAPFVDLEKKTAPIPVTAHGNFYDFIFIDTNQRRHEISLAPSRYPPFFMEEVSSVLLDVWEEIITGGGLKGMTQSKLKNIEALWGAKADLWGATSKEFASLVHATLDKEFPRSMAGNKDRIVVLAKNKLFFRLLELHQGILKQRV